MHTPLERRNELNVALVRRPQRQIQLFAF